LQVITPLLRILEKMHSLKLLHRDIKPENIFLTGLGKFRLGDFGLAIKFDEEVPFSRSGTLDYMAPEVRQLALKEAVFGAAAAALQLLMLHALQHCHAAGVGWVDL
jgi:serine/threonine protein kinase